MPSIAKLPTTSADSAAVGSVPWANHSRIYQADSASATNNTGICNTTHKLVGGGFNFNIPLNARVIGAVIQIRYANSTPSSSGCMKVHACDIIAGSSAYSVNSVPYVAGGSSNTWVLGSSTSLLPGLSSSPAQWNSGVTVRYWATVAPSKGVWVDYFQVTVYYTLPTYSLAADLPASAIMNQEFNYTITLTNTNGIHQGYVIPTSIVLPEGTSYISQSGSNGSYNPSTGKWDAVLSNGTATLTLRLKSTTVGTKPINASVDGYSVNLTKTISIINPDNEISMSVTAPATMELTEPYDTTVTISGNWYNSDPINVDINLPPGFTVSAHSIVSSSNVSNVTYSNGVLSFNLTTLNPYNFNLSYKLTVIPRTEGSMILAAYNDETGAYGSTNIAVVFTQTITAGGFKTQIRSTGSNAIGYTDVLQGYATGFKTKSDTNCTALADIIYGYIGPILLEKYRSHQIKGLKNTTKNTLIKEGYKNRVNIGKKGDYSEDIPLKIRLPKKHAITLQGLVELDEVVAINTNVKNKDGDPLNHRGYAEIHQCDIEYLNNVRYDCEVKLEYITRNLNPPIYVNRLSQINKYNLKPLYPVELMNNLMDLDDYFIITTDGSIANRTVTLSELDSIKFKSKNAISTPATFEFTWSSNAIANIERSIRIVDETGKILLQYSLNPVTTSNEDIDAYISIFDYDGGVDADNHEIDLKLNAGQYSTVTRLHINENVVSILEEGNSGVELSLDSLVLEPGNYYIEFEIKHKSATSSVTTLDFNIDETHLLTNEKSYFINQVVSSFPLKDKVLQYTRVADDGLLYYYRHDEVVAKYYAQPFVLYKGGTNVTTIEGGSILSNRYSVDPIVLTNGLVKIVFSYKLKMIRIYLYDYYADAEDKWILIWKFRLINMENINVHYISQDKATMSVGGTLWTIYRGRYSIDVEHPEQDIFTKRADLKDTVWRDDGDGAGNEEPLTTTETLLSLNNLYYLLMYNQAESYGIQVIRPDYSAIYNTKIPRNAKTVLIPYKRTGKDPDLPGQLAIEWLNMYEQKINISGN